MEGVGKAEGVVGNRRKKESGKVGTASVLKLLQAQGYRCAMTGVELTPETASLDHVIPVSRGGLHEISNVQIVHSDVNRAKSTLLIEEFVELCRSVVEFADQKRDADGVVL